MVLKPELGNRRPKGDLTILPIYKSSFPMALLSELGVFKVENRLIGDYLHIYIIIIPSSHY
jgi:hypothetical protein